jgi:hypothetical protein
MKITIDTDTVVKPVKKFSSKTTDILYRVAKSTGNKGVGTLAIWFPKTCRRYGLWRIKKVLDTYIDDQK